MRHVHLRIVRILPVRAVTRAIATYGTTTVCVAVTALAPHAFCAPTLM
jgi:hypothetical protein